MRGQLAAGLLVGALALLALVVGTAALDSGTDSTPGAGPVGDSATKTAAQPTAPLATAAEPTVSAPTDSAPGVVAAQTELDDDGASSAEATSAAAERVADRVAGRMNQASGPLLAVAPSHVAEPSSAAIADVGSWSELAEMIHLFKYYGVQVPDPDAGCEGACSRFQPVAPEALAALSTEHGIGLAVEFGDFVPPSPDELGTGSGVDGSLRRIAEQTEPVVEAGGHLVSIHFDGPVRRLMGLEPQRPGGLSLDEAVEHLVAVWGGVAAQHPGVEIGVIVNLPLWDLDDEHHGVFGFWSDRSGLTYLEVLDRLDDALAASGHELGFVEIDLPRNLYVRTRTDWGDRTIDHLGQLRRLSRWGADRSVGVRFIVNTEPETGGAAQFREGTVAQADALIRAGLDAEAITIQSWYREPSAAGPETADGSFFHTALAALRVVGGAAG